MKIVTYNINGIRAANKNGIIDWINSTNADIYCFQEIRCNEEVARNIIFQQNNQMSLFNSNIIPNLSEYYSVFNCGSIAGYAGTLILTKIKPDIVFYDMGEFWSDKEGRTTTIIIKDVAIINCYVPNGNSRLEFKMQYLNALNKYISHLKNNYKIIVVGDFNIAHTEIDLTNPKECKNKSVFLPCERDAFSDLLNLSLIDCFRFLNQEKREYTWKSYRSRIDTSYNSWQYRIDYILLDSKLKNCLKNCQILDLPYSDHLAIVSEIKI